MSEQGVEPIRLELELQPTTPITGRLLGAAGEATEFVGWTELVASLQGEIDATHPGATAD